MNNRITSIIKLSVERIQAKPPRYAFLCPKLSDSSNRPVGIFSSALLFCKLYLLKRKKI